MSGYKFVKKKIAGMIGMILILTLLPMASFAATNTSIKEGGINTPYWMGVSLSEDDPTSAQLEIGSSSQMNTIDFPTPFLGTYWVQCDF